MASVWHPYNVELTEEAEDEVDDTQEIQIEEALKLYQTALKYHSEGPSSYDQTAAAYKALFESEIFKYTESLSEFRKHELFGDALVFDSILEDDFEVGPVPTAGAADSAPNTLPQILHLSYKNHGQFLLESMQHCIANHGAVHQTEGWDNLRSTLHYFAEALDKEDTDLDLWLRAASVAAMLGSKRLTRYCLETVLDGNDEQWEGLLSLPGLEEGFAGYQLRELVEQMEDTVSLMQTSLFLTKRKKLSDTLKKRLNPFPFAPLPSEVAHADNQYNAVEPPRNIELSPTKWDWTSVGESLLQTFMADQHGLAHDVTPGSRIVFTIPMDVVPALPTQPDSATLHDDTTAHQSEQSIPLLIEQPPMTAIDSGASISKLSDDAEMEDANNSEEKREVVKAAVPVEPVPMPSRKRSTDSAGLPETAEGGRSRSKRIRGRETISEPNISGGRIAQEGPQQIDEQLEPFNHADQCLFEIVKDIYSRMGIENTGQPSELRNLLKKLPVASAVAGIEKIACDLYATLQNGNSKAAQILLSSESFDLTGVTRDAGLNAFLGFAKSSAGMTCNKPILEQQHLDIFAQKVNKNWFPVKVAAFAWVECLLSSSSFSDDSEGLSSIRPTYMRFRWPEDLKRSLVQIIVNIDEYLYECMLERVDSLNCKILQDNQSAATYKLSKSDVSQIEMVETLFELHLDIYSLIKHPHSQVDRTIQTLQSDRLERWSALARDVMQLRSSCLSGETVDDLALRHIWASVFQMSVNDDMHPEMIVSAMGELKNMLQAMDDYSLEVQNNAIMPDISVAAIDRELVRINMKDFFLKVFDQEEKDPVTIVECLEPILEDDDRPVAAIESESDQEFVDARTSPMTSDHAQSPIANLSNRPSPILEMRKFLDGANVNVRLSLWHRLREAYDAIEYPPKVVSCFLRSIETLVKDLRSSGFQDLPALERQHKLFTRYRIIDDMTVNIIRLIRDDKSAFDCLSFEHVQSSISAVLDLLQILSAANMFRDLVRINHIPSPKFDGMPNSTFSNVSNKLDEMQLRLWILQYHLLKEGISQNTAGFPTPSEDQFEFLRHVHHSTGIRGFCHLSTRQFLRLAKDEVLRFTDISDAQSYDTELCQILNDLYGLKLFIEPADCQDFHTTSDALDKKAALGFLSFVMSQTEKIDLKDLPRSEIRGAIEKVHAALGRPKQNDDISFNRKVISSYLKSAIMPVSLYNCLKGVDSLLTKHIAPEEAVAASKGWHFLMGNIALTRFRAQKRMTQGPTEDLNYAQAFFVQDLEYSIERWETWYRLAQANDTQLEEAVSWNADKLNSNTVELINFQRAAINSYTMAVACALRDTNVTSQSLRDITQMYTDFGNRIYASCREPFSMEAFQIREGEKRFCNSQSQAGTYKDVPFVSLQVFAAWKFASTLFKRAIRGSPDKWWNYYMLGKCRWKMWRTNDDAKHYVTPVATMLSIQDGPGWEEAINAFISAIEMLPSKKGRSTEPILEPHYKLVTVVHKLFLREAISYEKAVELLVHTTYAQKIQSPEGPEDWERYILSVLKSLRTADKSSWHHRITARSAHIIYHGGKTPVLALAAKSELTQQMFTKTMAVQVWKPEYERPGRHFVYTSRYTKFFIELLEMTGDKTNFEALLKRVRRKQTDFFEHQKLWQDMCSRYLKLLRRIGNVLDGQEDAAFKSLNHEEFSVVAARIEAWSQNPATQHPVLDVLRDAIEFKKLNNGLIKSALIDEVIGDTYGTLYTLVGPTLPPLPSELPSQSAIPLPSALSALSVPHTGAVPISSLMHVQMDGNSDSGASTPFNIHHPSQLQPQASLLQPSVAAPSEAPKPRAKAVGRREIQRRAEACVQKPTSATLQGTAIPIRSPPVLNATLKSLVERTTSPDKCGQDDPLQASFEKSGTTTAAASISNNTPGGSAPASVHDDADDESELSELDEEEVQEIEQEVENEVLKRSASISTAKPFFPNLIVAGRSSPEQAANASDDSGADIIHLAMPRSVTSTQRDVDMDVDTDK